MPHAVGVNSSLLSDGGLSCAPLCAVTATVCGTPFVSPVMTQVCSATVQLAPPGVAVAVYAVIGAPPSLVGALHVTVASPLPGVTTTSKGGEGAVAGIVGSLGSLTSLDPTIVWARTSKVYAVPFSSPTMVHEFVVDPHVSPPGEAVTS
jgi:hypothetical protein